MKKNYYTFKADQDLLGMENVTAKEVIAVCENRCKNGFEIGFAIRRFEQWFYNTNKEPYVNYICRKDINTEDSVYGDFRNQVKGFNQLSPKVELDHVFIDSKGTFFFCKEDAQEDFGIPYNRTGLQTVEILHNNLKLYRTQETNVFN